MGATDFLTWTTTSPRRSFSRLPWTPRRRRHWRGVTTGWSSRRRRGHNRRRTDGCGASSSSRWHPRSQGSLQTEEPTGSRIGEYPRRRRGRASRRRRRPGSTSRSYGPRKPTWFARSAPPKTRCSSGSEASTPLKPRRRTSSTRRFCENSPRRNSRGGTGC